MITRLGFRRNACHFVLYPSVNEIPIYLKNKDFESICHRGGKICDANSLKGLANDMQIVGNRGEHGVL